MKREIKFRVWETRGSNCGLKPRMVYDIYCLETNAHYMQYTGLKDKNGKEIYEGDIVDWNGENVVVKFEWMIVDAFAVYGVNLWTFHDEYGKNPPPMYQRIQSEVEVIGNIYENPELNSKL